jgi:hypothetical protein
MGGHHGRTAQAMKCQDVNDLNDVSSMLLQMIK